MSTQKKLKAKFLELYKESKGHIAGSCMTLGIDRGTFYNWKQADADFNHTIELLDESFVESVEAVVQKKILEGSDLWMWRYLKAHKGETWKDEVKGSTEHSGVLKLEITNKTITGPAIPPKVS